MEIAFREFDPNEIVKWTKGSRGQYWSIIYQWTDGHAEPYGTTIIQRGERTAKVPSVELQRLTFREAFWFQHPITLKMMCVKTRGWVAVVTLIFGYGLALASLLSCFIVADGKLIEFDPLPLSGVAIGLAVIGGFIYGSWKNWRGDWV